MADITITDLDADSSVAESDLFLKRTSNGADYKTTAGKIKEYVKSALINEGTGSSSFATVAQIAKASGVSLTTGTSSVLGSTTVEVFDAIKTYGKNTKSNVTAILSGLEIGDLDYTKYTNSSGAYESQLSVEIEYTYANGRGYAHIIPKLKNQQSYTMYMLSSNTSLDGVWQKDTDKVLSETHYKTLDLYGSNNIPLVVGNITDKVVGTYLTSRFGDQQVTYTILYHPEVGKKGNNMLVGAQRNTVVGSGILTHDTFCNENVQSKTDANNLYLCGENEIDFYTGSVSQSSCKKSTLDKSGNLAIANNITANGTINATKDATANGATLVQNMYSKCLLTDESSKKSTPYCLLAYKNISFKHSDSNVAKFHFTMNDSDQYFDCDLKFFARWSNETTATAPQKIGLYASNVSSSDSLYITNLFKLRYTFTPYTDTSNLGSIECWIYLVSTTATGYNYANIELFGKEENVFHSGYNVSADARTWTYYKNQAATADMLGTVTVNAQWAKENIGSLNASSGRISDLTTVNSTILSFGNGNKLMANSDGSVGFTTSTGTYNLIDSDGNPAWGGSTARVSTTEPSNPVDGDMWFV
jgi:hypothetical protein